MSVEEEDDTGDDGGYGKRNDFEVLDTAGKGNQSIFVLSPLSCHDKNNLRKLSH